MRAAVYGIYAVGEAAGVLAETVVILQGSLNDGAVYRFVDIDGLGVPECPGAVEVADEAGDAALEVEGQLIVAPLVTQEYLQALIQVGYLPDSIFNGIEVVSGVAENLLVGEEGGGGTAAIGFTDDGDIPLRYPLLELLMVDLAVESVITVSRADFPVVGCTPTGMPRPLSSTDTELSSWMMTLILSQ
jgi:hypothetical protein